MKTAKLIWKKILPFVMIITAMIVQIYYTLVLLKVIGKEKVQDSFRMEKK